MNASPLGTLRARVLVAPFQTTPLDAVGRVNRGGRCTGRGSASTRSGRWVVSRFDWGAVPARIRRDGGVAASAPSPPAAATTRDRVASRHMSERFSLAWLLATHRMVLARKKSSPRSGCPCSSLFEKFAASAAWKKGWRPAVLEEQGGILEDHMPGASSLEWRKLRLRGDHATVNLVVRSPLEL